MASGPFYSKWACLWQVVLFIASGPGFGKEACFFPGAPVNGRELRAEHPSTLVHAFIGMGPQVL